MTSQSIDLQDLPPLAIYKRVVEYVPQYGDFIVWTGWFSTWVGVVTHFDKNTNELHVIFSTIPYLLFTMSDVEQKKETRKIDINKIKSSQSGTYAVLQRDYQHNVNVWYI